MNRSKSTEAEQMIIDFQNEYEIPLPRAESLGCIGVNMRYPEFELMKEQKKDLVPIEEVQVEVAEHKEEEDVDDKVSIVSASFFDN